MSKLREAYDFIPLEIRERIIWKKDKKVEGDPDSIVGFKEEPSPCKDCNIMVENRTIRMSISRSQNHHAHIKHQCQICKMYMDPDTGVYNLQFHDLNSRFLKKKN